MQRRIAEIPSIPEGKYRPVKSVKRPTKDILPGSPPPYPQDEDGLSNFRDRIKESGQLSPGTGPEKRRGDVGGDARENPRNDAEILSTPENNELDNENWFIDTLQAGVERIDTADTVQAGKIGRSAENLAETLAETTNSFGSYDIFEEIKDFSQDLSHAIVGTSLTDKMRGGIDWLLGNKTEVIAEREQHKGVREIPAMIAQSFREFPAAFLKRVVDIPSDLGRRLEEFSPNTAHERRQLAQEMETNARETRDRILASIQKEKDLLHSQSFSLENIQKFAELNARSENVESDYADEVAKAKEIAPGTIESGLKDFAWVSVVASLDALSYTLGMGHIVKEAGEALAKGIRGERRKIFAERAPHAPYSKDVISVNTFPEKTMGIMEQLGDWMMTKALELQENREELTDTLHEEVVATKQKEASIMQDVVSRRIEGLVEKIKLSETRLSKAEMEEISHLTVMLNNARKGLLAADEINTLIERSRNLTKDRDDNITLLMGYLSGRAINTIKNLDVIPPEARKALIAELQEHPSPQALQAVESVIYASLDESVHVSGVTEISPEQRAQLNEARKVLQESIQRATDTYTSNLAIIGAEITKGLQAANRELKKVAVEAEVAHSERAAA